MSKFGTFGDDPDDNLGSAEKALLAAWRPLERWRLRSFDFPLT